MSTFVLDVIMTANDEEPSCGKCDYVVDAPQRFCDECGQNFWCHYRRSVFIERNEGND